MKRIFLASPLLLLLANGGGCNADTNPAAERQAEATRQSMDNADRQTGMPRIVNYAQKKLLKNAYEDMDQTVLTYAYTQGLDGKFVCIGQSLGYGVSLGTSYTAPKYPQYIYMAGQGTSGTYDQEQPEPNGLYMPSSGDATIVDLVDPKTGHAHTAVMEVKVVTVPFELPASSVSVQCPEDIDPSKVVDAKETSIHQQR